MKQIVDENGVAIAGLFRDSNGCIVVKDASSLSKYKTQKSVYDAQQNTINTLKKDVEELRAMFAQLMKDKQNV